MTTKLTALPLALLALAALSAPAGAALAEAKDAQLSVSATVVETCTISSNQPANMALALSCAERARPLIETSEPRTLAYGAVEKQFVVTTIQF